MYLDIANYLKIAIFTLLVIFVAWAFFLGAQVLDIYFRKTYGPLWQRNRYEKQLKDYFAWLKICMLALVGSAFLSFPLKFLFGAYLKSIDESTTVFINNEVVNKELFMQDIHTIHYSKGQSGSSPTIRYIVEILDGDSKRFFEFAKDSSSDNLYWISHGGWQIGWFNSGEFPYQ